MSGSLPEGWAVATLGDLCVQISDGTHQTPRYVSNGVPFYSVESVTNDDFENVKYITPEEARTIGPRAQPRRGDILMTRIGTLAKTKYIDWERAASAYVSLAILRPGPGIDGRFLYAYTKSEQFIRDVEDRSLAWAVPKKINMRDISDVPVMYPRDRAEQLRIADLELTADAHLLALDRVLAKKRAIKQGMMQELLTGRTRLPGFRGEWTPAVFGEIASPSRERSDPKSAIGRVVELEHLSPGTGRLLGDADLAASGSPKTRFLKGDVLFGKLRAYLRKYWLADRDGFASTEIWALRARTGVATGLFVRYLVEQDSFIEVASTAYGTHMPRSDWKVVSRYALSLPSLVVCRC